MSERPEQLEWLDKRLAGAKLGHETIFGLHRRSIDRGSETRSSELLAESAQIVLVGLPRLTGPLRRLGVRWEEESLLDPTTASATAALIAREYADIEGRLRALLARQIEIARELRVLLGP